MSVQINFTLFLHAFNFAIYFDLPRGIVHHRKTNPLTVDHKVSFLNKAYIIDDFLFLGTKSLSIEKGGLADNLLSYKHLIAVAGNF